MRLACCFCLLFFSLQMTPQSIPPSDFSITLERTGCLGICPWYSVTIDGDGSVRYEGKAYVYVEGLRKKTIPISAVTKLIDNLQGQDFFHWDEKSNLCVDYPEVIITANLKEQHKQVIEGCSAPGKVLTLAEEIDTVSGAKNWIGNVREELIQKQPQNVQVASENKRCTDKQGRRALDNAAMLRTWDGLYKWYKRFGQCDDGAIGEGFSESVARILVDHWDRLSRLAQLARQDAAFQALVIAHVDATLEMDDVEKIKENARRHCPTGLEKTCTELAKQAGSALREVSSP